MSISRTRRLLVWNRDGGVCQICFTIVRFEEVTMDHVQPKSLGGDDRPYNLRSAHEICNRRRGNNNGGPTIPGTVKGYGGKKRTAVPPTGKASTDERIALQKQDEDDGRYSG